MLDELKRGNPEVCSVVTYGSVIQLQHVASGLFVAAHKQPASVDPAGRKVSLKHGSAAAHFFVQPTYKSRTKGTPVYEADSLMFQSMKLLGQHLSVSQLQYPGLRTQNARRGAGRTHARRYSQVYPNCVVSAQK